MRYRIKPGASFRADDGTILTEGTIEIGDDVIANVRHLVEPEPEAAAAAPAPAAGPVYSHDNFDPT